MKRINQLCLVLLMVFVSFMMIGCSDREPIVKADFIATMTDAGFNVIDISHEFVEFDDVDYLVLAIAPSGEYQVEFVQLATIAVAHETFVTTRQRLENQAGSSSSTTSTEVANYRRFTITSNGQYAHLYLVENTMILVDWVDASLRNEIRELVGKFEN